MTQQKEVARLQAETAQLIEQAQAVLAAASLGLDQGELLLSQLGMPSDPSRIEAAMRSEFTNEQISEMKERIRHEMAHAETPSVPAGWEGELPQATPSTAARPRRHHRTV